MDRWKAARQILFWAVDIVMMIMLAFFLVEHLFVRIEVDGRSMEPALSDEDVVFLDQICYNFRDPDRFDIIAFSEEEDPDKLSVKRIIGLPGETVRIEDGIIYIDGEPLDASFFPQVVTPGMAEEEITVGEAEYFVLGDWPDVSVDSRFESVGNVSAEQIEGRVWFRISPLSEIGRIGDGIG